MVRERIEGRVLGALRVVDHATALPLRAPLRLHSDTARVLRNRSGLYVITEAEGLQEHAAAFARPPDTPAPGSVVYRFTIVDPAQRYLPRQLRVPLPRVPEPTHADSLFTPRDVPLYPAASAGLSPNWSTVRVSVRREGTPVRGALLRVIERRDDRVLASGISDERGEALVIVPGVPVTRFADEDDSHDDHAAAPVVVATLPVRLELSLTPGGWPVDPDELERNHADNLRDARDLGLRTGGRENVEFNLIK